MINVKFQIIRVFYLFRQFKIILFSFYIFYLIQKVVPIDDALDMIAVIKHGYLSILKNGSHMIIIEQQFNVINNLIQLFINDSFLYEIKS